MLILYYLPISTIFHIRPSYCLILSILPGYLLFTLYRQYTIPVFTILWGIKQDFLRCPPISPTFPILCAYLPTSHVLVLHARYFRLLRGYRPVSAIYFLLNTIPGETYTAIYPSFLSYLLSTYPPFAAFPKDVPACTIDPSLLSPL